jgi:hypothetical protein
MNMLRATNTLTTTTIRTWSVPTLTIIVIISCLYNVHGSSKSGGKDGTTTTATTTTAEDPFGVLFEDGPGGFGMFIYWKVYKNIGRL